MDIRQIFSVLEKHTTPSGNISGRVYPLAPTILIDQEERDFCFGRLFGLNILLQSELLLRSNTPSDAVFLAITQLVQLATAKSWLREPSARVICHLITAAPRMPHGNATIGEIVRQLNESAALSHSQEGVAILLAMDSLPTPYRQKSSKVWHHSDPLHPDNFTMLVKLLKEVPSETVRQTGNFNSTPPFIWNFILTRYTNNDAKQPTVSFSKLWRAVVNGMSVRKAF